MVPKTLHPFPECVRYSGGFWAWGNMENMTGSVTVMWIPWVFYSRHMTCFLREGWIICALVTRTLFALTIPIGPSCAYGKITGLWVSRPIPPWNRIHIGGVRMIALKLWYSIILVIPPWGIRCVMQLVGCATTPQFLADLQSWLS